MTPLTEISNAPLCDSYVASFEIEETHTAQPHYDMIKKLKIMATEKQGLSRIKIFLLLLHMSGGKSSSRFAWCVVRSRVGIRVTREFSHSRTFTPSSLRGRRRDAPARGSDWSVVPARTGTTWYSRIALLAGLSLLRQDRAPFCNSSMCAGATAVAAVGRHPRDYIDPRGSPVLSSPFRRVLLPANHPECDLHDNARPLLPDSSDHRFYQPPGICTTGIYSVTQLRPVDHV